MTDLDEVIHHSPAVVHPNRYAYLRATAAPSDRGHLMVCTDAFETTVVTTESRVQEVAHDAIESWFRLLEFRITVPFAAPGFLARISTALADAGLNILIVSTFGRDYVLLREHDLEAGVDVVRRLGFPVHFENG